MLIVNAPADAPAALPPAVSVGRAVDVADPLPDSADLAAARLALGGAHVCVHLDDVAHLLPQLFALADGVLVPQHVVAQLADADPGLREGFLVLDVQGGLGGEAVEG